MCPILVNQSIEMIVPSAGTIEHESWSYLDDGTLHNNSRSYNLILPDDPFYNFNNNNTLQVTLAPQSTNTTIKAELFDCEPDLPRTHYRVNDGGIHYND